MKELFNNYSTIIVFLHVFSAVIWIGGMVAIRVAVHPTMHTIEDKKIRVGKTLMVVGRLFNLVMPFYFFTSFNSYYYDSCIRFKRVDGLCKRGNLDQLWW